MLKEAKSAANSTKSVENLVSSVPDNPADFPNVAKFAAAPIAWFWDCPNASAAVLDQASISFAPSPKITPTLLVVSCKSDEDEIADIM